MAQSRARYLIAGLFLALTWALGPVAAQTIPNLPAVSAPAPSDLFAVSQGGGPSKKETAAQLVGAAPGVINLKLPPYSAAGDGVENETTKINAAITAGCATGVGARIYMPAGTYLITPASINVTCSDVGFEGDGSELTFIEALSGMGDLIDFTGTGACSAYLQHNFVRHLSLHRTVAPTIGGGSKGLGISCVNWFTAEDVFSSNSVYEFYQINSTAVTYLLTQAFRTFSYQGSGDIYVGYRVTGNAGNFTTKFMRAYSTATTGVLFGGTANSYGRWIDGADLRDISSVESEADNTYYGNYLDATGAGGTLNWDDRFTGDTTDTFGYAGWYITGLTSAGQVTINGGWTNPATTSSATFGAYVTGSQGIVFNGVQNFGGGNSANATGFYATNSSNVVVSNNLFKFMEYGVYFDNSTAIVNLGDIAGNIFMTDTSSHLMTAAVYLKASTRTSVINNLVNGNAAGAITNGIVGNSSPSGITIAHNQFNPAAIASALITGFPVASSNVIADNVGYNPIGVSTGTVGASPATLCAGPSQSTYYFSQSATNTATVTVGGNLVGTMGTPTTVISTDLGPNECAVVTWATTAPTYTASVH